MLKQVSVVLTLNARSLRAYTGEEPGKPTPGVCPTQVSAAADVSNRGLAR